MKRRYCEGGGGGTTEAISPFSGLEQMSRKPYKHKIM